MQRSFDSQGYFLLKQSFISSNVMTFTALSSRLRKRTIRFPIRELCKVYTDCLIYQFYFSPWFKLVLRSKCIQTVYVLKEWIISLLSVQYMKRMRVLLRAEFLRCGFSNGLNHRCQNYLLNALLLFYEDKMFL